MFCQKGFVYKGIRRIEIDEYEDYIILANTKYSNIGVKENEVIHYVDDILFNENFVIISFPLIFVISLLYSLFTENNQRHPKSVS